MRQRIIAVSLALGFAFSPVSAIADQLSCLKSMAAGGEQAGGAWVGPSGCADASPTETGSAAREVLRPTLLAAPARAVASKKPAADPTDGANASIPAQEHYDNLKKYMIFHYEDAWHWFASPVAAPYHLARAWHAEAGGGEGGLWAGLAGVAGAVAGFLVAVPTMAVTGVVTAAAVPVGLTLCAIARCK